MSLQSARTDQFALAIPIEPTGFSELLKDVRGRQFASLEDQVEFVVTLAQHNTSLWTPEAAPFAAAIFNRNGEIVGAGIDYPDRLRGHEMNNSLTRTIRRLDADYDSATELTVVSITPACVRCFDELVKFLPGKVISMTHLSDLIEVLKLPEAQLSPSNWINVLQEKGVVAVEGMYRELGLDLLKSYNTLLNQVSTSGSLPKPE